MKFEKTIKSNFVDIPNRTIRPAHVFVKGTRIERIEFVEEKFDTYILPGFVDAHIHIESSMLVPSEFARIAVIHGTVGTVSDPHEIANVLGIEGVKYMINEGKEVPFHFYFGASPCVPATPFETSGDVLSLQDIDELLQLKEVKYLSEMMNWPGVLAKDPDVLAKIHLARKYGKPVDGHAPGLMGDRAKEYIDAGISTDHECFTEEEALVKLKLGMKVQIREGSAARNFDALSGLIDSYYENLMFCSDDKHPDDLQLGHINQLVVRAIAGGHDVFKVLQIACINPIEHYKLEIGQLRVGDFADFIEVTDLQNFDVLSVWVQGKKVAENGASYIPSKEVTLINRFAISGLNASDLAFYSDTDTVNVIQVKEGELVTNRIIGKALLVDGKLLSNVETDVLKLVVVNRYSPHKPAVAFISQFGFRGGAIASSVAHDSHNIIAVGVSDEDIYAAIQLVIDKRGGLSFAHGDDKDALPLPVAGLMSNQPWEKVSEDYRKISAKVAELGCHLKAPYMSLSFMALLVIPSIKLSDQGLFDADKFEFMDVICPSKC
jgi:adenine deaminase